MLFDKFHFDPDNQVLFHDGAPLDLGSRAVEVLSVLLEANGGLVSKNTLMDRVWPGVAVEENNLQVQVSALRKALGDRRDLIRTVPGRGYRLIRPGADDPVEGRAEGRAERDETGPEAGQGSGDGRLAPSIVVLPLRNLSSDPGLDYLVDGITDSLTTDLSRALPGSFVVSRSTAFSFKGRLADTRMIGAQLRVRYVLEGSVLPTPETLRVNAQLIDAATDTSLWAERFDKPRHNVLQVQDEIVGRLSRAIGIEVIRSAASAVAGKDDPEALDLALRGRAVVYARIRPDTAVEATALFRRALELDGSQMEALAGLASVLVYQVVNFFRSDRDAALDEADSLLERAFTVDPGHIGARRIRATLLRARGDFAGAIAINQALVAQNPGEPTAFREIGLSCLYLGRFAEAVEAFQGADRIAPLDPVRWTWLQGLGRTLVALGDDAGAVEALRLAVESRPCVAEIHGLLVAAEALAGNLEQARAHLADYLGREPGMTVRRWSARSHVSPQQVAPAYGAANGRILEGLRRAGLPED